MRTGGVMRAVPVLAVAFAGFISQAALAHDSSIQPPWPRGWPQYRPNLDVALGVNFIDSQFGGLGSTSDSTGFFRLATDVYDVRWDTALRYAGEFGGFRIAAAVGYTQGIGTASESLGGGITGKTNMGASFDFTFRAGPSAGIFRPYLIAGVAITHVDIKASPFESGSGWVPGLVVGFGGEVGWGAGTIQNVDQAATRIYLEYRHYENDDMRISGNGGSRHVDTDFDMILGGARTKF
jgi:hypothetical protein